MDITAIKDFVKPELLILIPVLYIIGVGLKKSKVKDEYIPLVLGASGIVLATLWVCGTSGMNLIGVFTAITQGILCAGATVYVDQLIKQANK